MATITDAALLVRDNCEESVIAKGFELAQEKITRHVGFSKKIVILNTIWRRRMD